MPFIRSLVSGVSGLVNHQIMMDTIGNNIANVNTIGFKADRVTFSEAFDEVLRDATGPSALSGGTNPIQIGLGMTIHSIDMLTSQGNLQTTGQNTDLALQGDGFFVVNLNGNQYYTRAGAFQFDAQGRLIDPGTGAIVQGKMADSMGNLPVGSAVQDIVIPFGQKSPAKASTYIQLTGNLDSSKTPLGTILSSNSVYAIDSGSTDVEGLLAADGSGSLYHVITGMVPDSTTFSVTYAGRTKTYTYVTNDAGVGKGDFHTLSDLLAEINNDFSSLNNNSSLATFNADGSIKFSNNSSSPQTLQVVSTNPVLQAAFGLTAPTTLAVSGSTTTQQFSHVAAAGDLLTNLRNAKGQNLQIIAGQSLVVNGQVGGKAVTSGTLSVAANSTYGDLANRVSTAFGISNSTATTIDSQTGALVINGDGGTANAITNVDITDASNSAAVFNTVFSATPGNWTQIQAATDVQQSISTTVYDSLGNQYTVTLTFTRDVTQPNTWRWKASVSDPAEITGGGSGKAVFNNDGSLRSFTYDDGSASLQINPRKVGNAANLSANLMSLTLNAGKPGDFSGLTQMTGVSTTVSGQQDGYGLGTLTRLSIDENGKVNGVFSNGTTRALAQVMVATFDNPGGLVKVGGNLFNTSASTGNPIIGEAGTAIPTKIVSGALEQSNVDLATEFANMIIAERGFQANSRVITVSDNLLNELVNLVR
ncbi:MAG: flagellar hook-basal body complex protein [Candidatus Kryptoniota bacterium]